MSAHHEWLGMRFLDECVGLRGVHAYQEAALGAGCDRHVARDEGLQGDGHPDMLIAQEALQA